MSGNHVVGNRNSTPEATATSSLRPPSSRAVGSGSSLRASADMASLTGSSPSSRIRPSSDFYGQSQPSHGPTSLDTDSQDKIAQQWIADIDQYETTLEEMAAATLDQDFKDELSAIEQWFRVLSEAERTAALYALLQQTTQVQIRFFIQVLQQMGKNHPMSGVLSPATFDKDPMSSRLSDAMNKLNVDPARNSFNRNSTISTTKRHSGLDPSTINAMFPDAAAAIATEKAKFTQQTGNPPSSNRNSAAIDPRSSITGSGIPGGAQEPRESAISSSVSPWGGSSGDQVTTSKTAVSQTPMGQFVQPPPSGGLRSPRPQISSNSAIQTTTLTTRDNVPSELPLLSPYAGGGSGNWASMVNTPMAPTFGTGNHSGTQADMIANATAMKLAALSTVNNRFALDDVRKYRRARSNDAPIGGHSQMSPPSHNVALPSTNVVMINEHGQVLNRDQVLALQAQQRVGLAGQRSRPSSPGIPMQTSMGAMSHFASPQHNGFLSAYDNSGLLNSGIPSVALGPLGMGGHEGYLSDHSDMVRGRSPRGRRGSSKPPEDPTDPTLLQDIPSWLRSLRLHKYTDNLKDMKWTELVELDDKALEDRGVNALGARRKMLKVFEQVKEAKADEINWLTLLLSDVRNDASDSDSDLEELQGDIAKYDESVREFLSSHRGRDDSPPPIRGGPRGRGARGPRKAAKPRGDITARLSKVNQAFLSGDYARALDLVSEVIRINAETHQAWTALSSIFREQGENVRALSAMVYAAHLRPKDVSGWLRCASFALDAIDEDESGNTHTARLCYSAAIRADPTNVEARLGKATVCHKQGHLAAAISEYNIVLKHRPQDLDIVRKLAEACIDNKNANLAAPSAIAAYRRFFDLEMANMSWYNLSALWHDVGIYVELFASTGSYLEAIHELKGLSRWLVGRAPEQFWNEWHADDCEWDADEGRRFAVPGFSGREFEPTLYGPALPLDLRVRLAIYRLRLGDEAEAFRHLAWLDPQTLETRGFVSDSPFLAFDIADELAICGQPGTAIKYFELLRAIPGDPDAIILLQLGRCYLATGEQSMAEEYFLAAIDADEDNIDARIELANMYEKAKEAEEALILAAEAMALRDAQDPGQQGLARSPVQPDSGLRRRRIPRVGSGGARPSQGDLFFLSDIDEQARAFKLAHQYEVVRGLKTKIQEGHDELIDSWMTSSKELVDDFRSLKRFYTWDKYLHFLGQKRPLEYSRLEGTDTELSQMYERLTRTVAPQTQQQDQEQQTHQVRVFENHQGISFDDWLDLFLDYAIGLAIAYRRDDAYQICQSAKDSTVFQSSEHNFTIYIAWSVCAIYTNDEEKCVTIARHLMRDGAISDSYRMFALLSKLCQSPVSWYTSGPAQKYILRQIKAIDAGHEVAIHDQGSDSRVGQAGVNPMEINIDICLLMLYGHILFTSTSYTYALGYFLRARSIDQDNPMVNLSLGLAYVHYGLKRQSTNRQYLLLQGQAFISQYAECSKDTSPRTKAERYYNVGRLFQLLGIAYLGSRYYAQALEAIKEESGEIDLSNNIMVNSIMSLLAVNNKDLAFHLLKEHVKI
ncbi:RNA-binding protein VTS1 [Cladobotryum mycophilum]|uniref:RNA-binding protein VTS1 n=1 Tax=Cladobotryum mycophilum TaxID=491253 RepID=A0ABR0S9A5_9HYPO